MPGAAGARPTSTGWWCATSTRSRPPPSGTTRPRCTRGDGQAAATSRPRSSCCPRRSAPRRTAPSPTPSGWCSGTTRRSSRPATAARRPGSSTSSAGACASSTPTTTARRGRRSRRSPGTTRPMGATASRTSTPWSARSTATRSPTASSSPTTTRCKDDGSTACGCWIYSGIMPEEGRNLRARTARATTAAGARLGLRLAGQPAHPLQPRLRRPRGPALERAQGLDLVGRRRRAAGPATTCPTSRPTKPPDYQPPPGAKGLDAHPGDAPVRAAGRRQAARSSSRRA